LWHSRGTNVGEGIHAGGRAPSCTDRQVAVDARDHRQARTGVPRDLEHTDAGSQPVGDGRVAQVVDASSTDSRGLESRLPFPPAPVVEIQVQPALRCEHESRLRSTWHAVKGGQGATRERDQPPARVRLPERLRALRAECPLHDDGSLGGLNVPPFEREPLRRPQCRLRCEHHERAVCRTELGGDPVHLGERERLDLRSPRLTVRA
jgi:hypothetical protein